MEKSKKKRRILLFYKDWLSFLTFTLILGILILSLGIYLVGIHFPNGNIILTLGSFIVYVSAIILAFKV